MWQRNEKGLCLVLQFDNFICHLPWKIRFYRCLIYFFKIIGKNKKTGANLSRPRDYAQCPSSSLIFNVSLNEFQLLSGAGFFKNILENTQTSNVSSLVFVPSNNWTNFSSFWGRKLSLSHETLFSGFHLQVSKKLNSKSLPEVHIHVWDRHSRAVVL